MTYDVAKDFQTLIVGILGFAGVMTTLWFNSWQARMQRLAERQHERETLRAAILEELKIIHYATMQNVEAGNEGFLSEPAASAVPVYQLSDAYNSFVGRLGLLSEDEVASIMQAYLSYRAFHANLTLFGKPLGHTGAFVEIPSQKSEILIEMYQKLSPKIESAIQAIERERTA
ncbi:hypothetical protein [Pelagibius sp. Alg239-R121]|uniref:hypothetical protein n=1 Tax=Pelagibius sp. Alg239-R121 TaxID=2993448 RepID=UPI0024A7402A|nr:hypothetical protein [Pelagibius sp. Alg239-R121]